MAARQRLLRLLSTEAAANMILYGDLAVFRAFLTSHVVYRINRLPSRKWEMSGLIQAELDVWVSSAHHLPRLVAQMNTLLAPNYTHYFAVFLNVVHGERAFTDLTERSVQLEVGTPPRALPSLLRTEPHPCNPSRQPVKRHTSPVLRLSGHACGCCRICRPGRSLRRIPPPLHHIRTGCLLC